MDRPARGLAVCRAVRGPPKAAEVEENARDDMLMETSRAAPDPEAVISRSVRSGVPWEKAGTGSPRFRPVDDALRAAFGHAELIRTVPCERDGPDST